MARGIALIVAAVLLGVVLLRATDDSDFAANASDGTSTKTTASTPVTQPDTTATSSAAAHNPAAVTVLVANGAGIDGLASKIADKLKAANFVTAEPSNTKAPADESAVYFTPGYQTDAEAVAALLSPPPKVSPLPDPPPVDDMKGGQVLVVAAADLAQAAG